VTNLILKKQRDGSGLEFVQTPDNSSTVKKEGFSYEYHYRTKEGLALTDFNTSCE